MAVIETTRPAFRVQIAASTQPSVKPASSNWQLAKAKPFTTEGTEEHRGKWGPRLGCLNGGRP
jgi:hypothetical protein